MSFLSTIGLIGVGYIIKDRIDNKPYQYKRSTYSGYKPAGASDYSTDYSNMNALQILSKRFAEVLADKVEQACYGTINKKSKQKINYSNYFSTNTIKVKEITFDARYKAEDALERLKYLHEMFLYVSVFDYYDICRDIDPCIYVEDTYTDNKYGWKNFDGVSVKTNAYRSYYVNLPEPELIKY